MKMEDIIDKFGCLIENPQVIFRITGFNEKNKIVEYGIENINDRIHAKLSEIKILSDDEVPSEIKMKFNEANFINLQ